MYEFPNLVRWFDIVDYTEFNSCRKIEVNMKKLTCVEISEFCKEFGIIHLIILKRDDLLGRSF